MLKNLPKAPHPCVESWGRHDGSSNRADEIEVWSAFRTFENYLEEKRHSIFVSLGCKQIGLGGNVAMNV